LLYIAELRREFSLTLLATVPTVAPKHIAPAIVANNLNKFLILFPPLYSQLISKH
jgi:hypothetical protein